MSRAEELKQSQSSFWDSVKNLLPAKQESFSSERLGNDEQQQAPAAQEEPQASPPEEMPSNVALPQQSQQSQDQDPYGLAAYNQANQQAINTGLSGIQQQATAEGQLGQQQSQAFGEHQQAAQALLQQHQTNLQHINQDLDKNMSDYMQGHIDPSHYWNSKSTASKVSTAVGLLLGGLGAGLGHGNNVALDMLNKNIDRDIESQMQDMNKKQNLLRFNFERFHNMQDAVQMTRLMQNDVYLAELQKQAALAKSPIAQAQAKQAMVPLLQQKAQLSQQIAMRQTMTQGSQSNPAMMVQMLVPKEHQKEALSALGSIEQLNALQKDTDEAAQHVSQKFGRGILTPSDTASAKNTFIGAIQKISEGRYNHDAAKLLADSFFANPGDSNQTVRNKDDRRRKFFDSFRADKEQPLKAFGIPVPRPQPATSPGAGPRRK